MKKVLTTLTLLLTTLGVFVWQLPASAIVALLPADASRFVQTHRVSGRLWDGRALVSVIGVAPALPLAWLCRPSLLPLGMRCELQDAVTGTFVIDALDRTIQFDRMTALVPVRYLTGMRVGAWSSAVAADIATARLSQQTIAIKGSLRAADAGYRAGAADVAVGDVTVDCIPTADAHATACALSNRGGSGRLDGQLNLTPGRMSGNIELTPSNGTPQRVAF